MGHVEMGHVEKGHVEKGPLENGHVEHRQTVIVGSGFGASVAACRLARSGRDTLVLERGKAYPPGSFARSPSELAKNFWDPSEGRHGMFDIWSFNGIDAVISSGLGGGSLIYANVLLRKDEHWFVEEDRVGPDGSYWTWPVTRTDLDPYYGKAEEMLGAQTFPFEHPDYATTPRTMAMRDAAAQKGLDWMLPPLAVSFANKDREPRRAEPLLDPDYGNLHGLPRTTCQMCGECDIGCNVGAKNTLDHNYLSAAQAAGAELRTRCDVRRIDPRPGGGWNVWYLEHLAAHEGHRTPSRTMRPVQVSCDRLILGAGTLGTTHLLLANRAVLGGISATLGTRFCGNGDLLGFMTSARHRNGDPRVMDSSNGPVITSAIRLPDAADHRAAGGSASAAGVHRGAYLEDAGYPNFLNWIIETGTTTKRVGRMARLALRRISSQLRPNGNANWSGELSSLIGTAEMSDTSMPLLGMGRDTADGVMRLRNGRLDVDWNMDTSADYFERLSRTMEDVSEALGARFVESLLTKLNRVVTVHPLGGAPMGRTIEEGTVDEFGKVFGLDDLYVFDGSVMPGPVGANPALTIAAFAERGIDHLLAGDPS